ncbi:putative DNA-binding protein (UPF0278 family) [Anoxybacillus kamchatkensis]|uniref:hypothetical protein n=1 Tax=Anoxybacillus ayderensis TaxID=265546 RepID=UPI0015EC8A03|nr:hypothetical protein [Anoxybacillus ayderensis]MBA2879326.1 putative DNA-binding protein (UPF0278 family) [Anoxybacillus ayderensis]
MNREYTLTEAAKRLAELKGKEKPYTRQYIHKLIREGKLNYREVGQEGTFYVTTEEDLQLLLNTPIKKGRPRKNS